MARLQKKNFGKPDETASPPKTKVETIKMGAFTLSRITFEPGWKWSTHAKPIARTEWCQKQHYGYIISGRLAAQMVDGTKMEYGPGDVMDAPPGHDGWVIGDKPVVWLEFKYGT